MDPRTKQEDFLISHLVASLNLLKQKKVSSVIKAMKLRLARLKGSLLEDFIGPNCTMKTPYERMETATLNLQDSHMQAVVQGAGKQEKSTLYFVSLVVRRQF